MRLVILTIILFINLLAVILGVYFKNITIMTLLNAFFAGTTTVWIANTMVDENL